LGVAGDDEEVEDGADGLAEEGEEDIAGDEVVLLAFAGDLSEGSEAAALGAGDLAVEEDGVGVGLGGIRSWGNESDSVMVWGHAAGRF
jgi:hypothetical protein